MSIPVVDPSASDWSRLDPAAKREHLLTVAAEIFTRDGLDAPMPVIADAAGAGVASVYRQFPSKHELLAALVIRRLEQITAGAQHAGATTNDHWTALTELLWTLVEQQRCDEFLGEAMLTVNQHPAVQAARRTPHRRPNRRTTPRRRHHPRPPTPLRRNPRSQTHRTNRRPTHAPTPHRRTRHTQQATTTNPSRRAMTTKHAPPPADPPPTPVGC